MNLSVKEIPLAYTNNSTDWINAKKGLEVCHPEIKQLAYVTLFTVTFSFCTKIFFKS